MSLFPNEQDGGGVSHRGGKVLSAVEVRLPEDVVKRAHNFILRHSLVVCVGLQEHLLEVTLTGFHVFRNWEVGLQQSSGGVGGMDN